MRVVWKRRLTCIVNNKLSAVTSYQRTRGVQQGRFVRLEVHCRYERVWWSARISKRVRTTCTHNASVCGVIATAADRCEMFVDPRAPRQLAFRGPRETERRCGRKATGDAKVRGSRARPEPECSDTQVNGIRIFARGRGRAVVWLLQCVVYGKIRDPEIHRKQCESTKPLSTCIFLWARICPLRPFSAVSAQRYSIHVSYIMYVRVKYIILVVDWFFMSSVSTCGCMSTPIVRPYINTKSYLVVGQRYYYYDSKRTPEGWTSDWDN